MKHSLQLWNDAQVGWWETARPECYRLLQSNQSGPAAAAAKSLQSCLTLCDPIDGSPPGSPVPRILQARTLEWVAISFSNARKWNVKVKSLSHVRLLATPWTAAYQAPLSMGFSRQEHWSGLPVDQRRRYICGGWGIWRIIYPSIPDIFQVLSWASSIT